MTALEFICTLLPLCMGEFVPNDTYVKIKTKKQVVLFRVKLKLNTFGSDLEACLANIELRTGFACDV